MTIALRKIEDDIEGVAAWDEQGSTVAAAVMVEGEEAESKMIVTANIGDSRVVLSRLGAAVDLTKDHKPNSDQEIKRIRELGGSVRWHGFFNADGSPMLGTGVYRVNGNLAVSRAVGDKSEKPYISAVPELRAIKVQPENDQFIIVATDGLWDVMTSEEAVRYVHQIMSGALGEWRQASDTFSGGFASDRLMIRANMEGRKRKVSRYLAEEAMRRGTHDNISIIVLWLQ